MATPPTISIAAVLIARNEARCIARCLDSVRPWVDRMIVVDTGSTDDTAAIARACGAEVHAMAWPDDFSAARNHALDLSDADWNLVIDADEWIAAGGERLHDWCAGGPRLGRVCILNAFDQAQGGAPAVSRSRQVRLLPRGVRYEGRVHEQPVSPLAREILDIDIGHDGYLDAQAARKQGRNRPLLLLDLAAHPDDPYLLYQLGKDAEIAGSHAEASGYYARAFDRVMPDAPWLHELTVRFLYCLGQAGRLDEALARAEDMMPLWQESPDFFFVLGNLLMDRAMTDPAHALDEWLPLAEFAWERCLDIGERPDLQGAVHGRGSHLAQHNLDVMRGQIALLGAARA